jgi:hypothetical protein
MAKNARKLPLGVGAAMLLVVAALGLSASTASALEAGGHVGVALPLVTLSKDTTNFIDDTVIATPLGIGLKLTDTFTLDFESVIFTPMVRGGRTSLMVDPGLIYHAGPVNLGLRVAFQIGQPSNIGAIPLVNVPLVKMEHATWFVEGAFPIFYMDKRGSFTCVLHTGFGF